MKKFLVISFFALIVTLYHLSGCYSTAQDGMTTVKEQVSAGIDSFKHQVNDSLLPLVKSKADISLLKQSFIRSRMLYKKIEWATEYFMPVTSRVLNGPPLPEIETEENKIKEPEGLQVIESMLFSDSVNFTELTRQTKLLVANISYCENYWTELGIDSAQVLDAARLEVFRIITLGISGFDAPLVQTSIPEAAVALQSVKKLLEPFGNSFGLASLFNKAIHYLNSFPHFENFDRLEFIRNYSEPLTKGIVSFQKQMNIPFVKDTRLLKPEASSLFEKGAFDINAYIQDSMYRFSDDKAALGKKLFYDPVLSVNNKRSCASCHQPAKAFTDGLTTSASLDGRSINRNAPTLLNAALQPWQFYDMRATNLENQSKDVISNKDEMHGDLDKALQEIAINSEYRAMLTAAFPNLEKWTGLHLQNALASYVRSLSYLNSRFDRYMRGENYVSLSFEEKQGFNLFMGKAKCGTCHFLPLFNGTVPPSFMKMESEVIGVPANKDGKMIDEDQGRYALFKLEPYLNAFKTTTVRNASRTAPYMHNGVFTSLEDVIEFYNKGGGTGLGIDIANQTLPAEKLSLSETEKEALIAFIKTLDDETGN